MEFIVFPLLLQDNTLVPQTPLMSAKVLREEEDVWMDVQVSHVFTHVHAHSYVNKNK